MTCTSGNPEGQRPTKDPPIHLGMDIPLEGCTCGDCEYARWFESLTSRERERELELIYAYAAEVQE